VSSFAGRHAKALLFAAVVLCLAGLWLLTSFPVGVLPDVTFPRLVIIVEAGDRPAETMVVDVVRPLEEALATVRGATKIRSKTQRGATEISVDFAWGTNIPMAQQLVSSRINEARPELPQETEITVEQMNPTVFPILGLSLHGAGLSQTQLWELATYTIRPRLARVPGVAEVVVQGGRIPEIEVDVDPQRLQAYQVSLPEVEQALSETNEIRGVGRLDQQYQQYQVLVSGRLTDLDHIGDVVVVERNGRPVLLRQLAAIRTATEDRTTIVTAGGAESVLINIVRQPDANTIAVANGVQAEIRRLRPTLPAGLTVKTFYDQSVLVKEAVANVRDSVLIGALLAIIVLLVFLGEVRATVLTAVVLPATLLIGFGFMRLAGLTLNLMSLGALAVGIGLVIDDAIVVVENTVRHLSHGESRAAAVRAAAAELTKPMIASTLTTVVVFLPLVLVTGVTGAFFTVLAITLVIALVVSLALALLISPTLCARYLRAPEGKAEHSPWFAAVIHWYERCIRAGLHRRRLLLPGMLAVVAVTAALGTQLGTGFMPEMDEGSFVLDYWTPPGTSLAESDRMLRKIERLLQQTPEVSAYSRRMGTELGFAITEPNTGDLAVMLKPRPRRRIDAVMDDLREKIAVQVPGVEVEFIQVLQDLIGDLAGAPAPIEVKLYGEDQQQLARLAGGLEERLGRIPGMVDTTTSLVESGPQLVVQVDPVRAGRVGLTAGAVADQANAAIAGDVATRILQGDRQIAVRVRLPAVARADRAQLALLPIRTPDGAYLPLSALATIATVPGVTEISREDQRRYVSITARLSGRDLGSVVRDVQRVMRAEKLPAGVTYALGGQSQSQAESFRGLMVVLVLAVLLVFGVMLFQFESFTAPLVILLVMPLSLFGVALGLWLTNTPLNVSSFMGAIMLVGIVGENGILLLDQIRKAEGEGMPVDAAAIRAGRVRLRPIMMTTLAAILALLPLALGLGAGAEMQKPLAIAVIGGLTFAMAFTLLVAPVLYATLRHWETRWRQRGGTEEPTVERADRVG
jgi:CzcA family heavy metal efflux pump